MSRLFVIGDIHGQYDKLVALLRDSGLIGPDLTWIAGRSTLWFLGDLVDRGPDSIGVIDLVMRLQREAHSAGGKVGCLLGNHEVVVLGAYRFGNRHTTGTAGTFLLDWTANGGDFGDLERLTPERLEWFFSLPAMALAGDKLLIHADSEFYYEYGSTIDAVNQAFARILKQENAATVDHLLSNFSHRDSFIHFEGIAAAREFLQVYGGQQIVHGHSPILRVTRQRAEAVTEPLVYAGGLCINLDGGMYMGGPGLIYEVTQGASN